MFSRRRQEFAVICEELFQARLELGLMWKDNRGDMIALLHIVTSSL